MDQIFVKSLSRTLVLDVSPSTTILELKAMITDKEGYKFVQNMLHYSGKPINDDTMTLLDYQIKNESTIHVGFGMMSCLQDCTSSHVHIGNSCNNIQKTSNNLSNLYE